MIFKGGWARREGCRRVGLDILGCLGFSRVVGQGERDLREVEWAFGWLGLSFQGWDRCEDVVVVV